MASELGRHSVDYVEMGARSHSIPIHASKFLRRHQIPLALVLVTLATRILFLSTSIDEIDSANFVNALENGYNIPLLRPHAPGYPVFLFLGSLIRPMTGDAVTALAIVSAVLGSLAVAPFYALLKEFAGNRLAIVGTLLFIVNPLFWSFSETALSDAPSVFAVVTLAWLAYRGRFSNRALIVAAITASLAIGLRQQNVACLPLLAYPFVYRAMIDHRPWRREATVSAEVFLATTTIWVAPMIMIGSDGLEEYVSAVAKQWSGAVQPYNIFHIGSPWILNAFERTEHFVVGYIFTYPWVGEDARTGIVSALQLPWVFGLALFLSRFSYKNPRHILLIVWMLSIVYQITTIHFLPRYGLTILPALVIAAVIGYGILKDELLHDRRRFKIISLVAIGSMLIVVGVKQQPPVASFEWVAPSGTTGGAVLVLSGVIVLIATRMFGKSIPPEIGLSPRRTLGRFRPHPVELALGLVLIPMALTSFFLVSTAHVGKSPNQRLVEFAQNTWDMDQVTVCWDGQTHGFFEVLSPGVTPSGFWTIDELRIDAETGNTLLLTDRCARFDEVASFVNLEQVAVFRGSNPVWSKASKITLFAGKFNEDARR